MKVSRKVAAGGVGGALVATVIGLFHLAIDPATAVGLSTLVTFAISWFIPEADTSTPVGTPEK